MPTLELASCGYEQCARGVLTSAIPVHISGISKLCIVLWLCIDEFGHARYIMAVRRVLCVSWLVAWLLFHETTVYILVCILCNRAVGF